MKATGTSRIQPFDFVLILSKRFSLRFSSMASRGNRSRVFLFVSFDSFSRSSGRDDRRRTRSGISHPLFIRKIFLYVETNRRFTHRNQKFFDIERPGSSEIGTFHGMDSVVIDRSFDFFNTNSEDRCAYQGLKNRNPLCRHSEKLTDSEQTIL